MCCQANKAVPKGTGIIASQWYGLLEARLYKNEKLVRIRNTKSRLTDGCDWTGSWGNADDEHWTAESLAQLNHTRATDGSFWMPFKEWVSHFDSVVIANVESGWDFISSSFNASSGSHIVAILESRQDTVAALSVRQFCSEGSCVPMRMCVVTSERPYLTVGGSHATFSSQILCTRVMHLLPGKYFVFVQIEEGKSGYHCCCVSSYSPSMGITLNNSVSGDADAMKASKEVSFSLPVNSEDGSVQCCAFCKGPLPYENFLTVKGKRLHPWCKVCYTCGYELSDSDIAEKTVNGESRLYCGRCAKRSELRTQKGETIRADVQKLKKSFAAEPAITSAREVPSSEPPPVMDPVTKERALNILSLSKERMKKASFLRSRIGDADVRSIFQVADHNKSGAIDCAEMTGILQSSGMCLSSIPAIQKYQVKCVMDEAEKGSETVSLKRFCKWYQHANWEAVDENMKRLERIAAIFLSFDSNGNATLERNELAALHNKLVADGITKVSFDNLFSQLDKNQSERIELNEFVEWFQQQS